MRIRGVLMLIMTLLLAEMTQAATIHLAWEYVDGDDPAISFTLYRDVGCAGGFLFRASIPRAQLEYVDGTNPADTLQPGQTYCYQVTAIGVDGQESGASNTLIFPVPLPTPPPNSPSHLRAL